MANTEIEGDERYIFTGKETIRKVGVDRQIDPDGVEYRVLQELTDGFLVYAKPADPSQPNPNYFIHKKYFIYELA